MSYRTFKRVLGETSLERKCRFLFGAALFVLILSSFLWYGHANERLVSESTRSNCQLLVKPALVELHMKALSEDERSQDAGAWQLIEQIVQDLQDVAYDAKFLSLEEVSQNSLDENPDQRWKIEQAVDWEFELLEELRGEHAVKLNAWRSNQQPSDQAGSDQPSGDDASSVGTFRNFAPAYVDRVSSDHGNYFYYEPVQWMESCVPCHLTRYGMNYDPEQTLAAQLDALPFRTVRITVPYEPTYRKINQNRALLLAMAIITVFLSMIALYIVVRYVIVKPLQHLQDVSEQVERGDYDARAEIETNDEFEQLAHAYNRMLRHMVDAQSELQTANVELDGKVDELAQANMQLFESNRVKGEFLANVSHELRTPLNSIIGFSDLLGDIESLKDTERRYASIIGRSGRDLMEMINDILDLAKIESGRSQVRPIEFSIKALVDSQSELIRKLAEDKNISLTVDCPSRLPNMFQDQPKVQQVLTNLLSNAIKFTPEGGRVKVIVDSEPDGEAENPAHLILTVQDTGVGIADEDRELIFEKFRQATATRGSDNLTREYSGTGLGLSIVRELSKLMQGRITFASELGKGSQFTVTLPWRLELRDDSHGSEDSDVAHQAAASEPANHSREASSSIDSHGASSGHSSESIRGAATNRGR